MAQGGFAGGFYGCFGVLAAVALCLVALATCGSLAESAKGKRLAEGAAPSNDYRDFCAAAAVQAERRYRTGELAVPVADPEVTRGPGGEVRLICVANGELAPVAIAAALACFNALEPDCVRVDLVRRGGREVARR